MDHVLHVTWQSYCWGCYPSTLQCSQVCTSFWRFIIRRWNLNLWANLQVGHKDSSTSNGHQGDDPSLCVSKLNYGKAVNGINDQMLLPKANVDSSQANIQQNDLPDRTHLHLSHWKQLPDISRYLLLHSYHCSTKALAVSNDQSSGILNILDNFWPT